MLTVTRLKLSNICQYESIDIPITTGLMAVCGRNGSGKSTLLRGLMYGLTGLVDGSWGTQANLQRDGCAIPGYVVVSLKDDMTNSELTIKRYSVSGTKFPDTVTEFRNGEYKEVATRRKTVDAYLRELYGIPVSLLFQLVWGRQGQLDLLLTAPAAYVSSFLSGVWDTAYLEKLREKLKLSIDQIAAMADPMAEIQKTAVEMLELEGKDRRYTETIEQVNKELAVLRKEKERLDKKISASSVEDAKKAAALSERIRMSTEDMNNTLRMLSGTDLDAVKDKPVQELQEQLTVAQKALADVSTAIDQTLAAFNALCRSVQNIADDRTRLEVEIQEIQDQKQRVHEFISGPNKDTCAFCGGKVKHTEAYLSNIMVALGYQTDRGYEVFDDKILLLQDELESLKRRHADVAEGTKHKQQQLAELDARKEQLNVEISTLVEDLNTAKLLVKYSQQEDNITKWQQELDALNKNAIDETLAETLQTKINGIADREQTISGLQSEQLRVRGRMEALKQIQDRLETEKEQADTNASARGMLTLIRDVFSQQRAQARYFASKTVELNEHLQAFLELTGMPFNLRLDSDKRLFSYTTEDGFEHPTAHLSGAQKNISAVALQMALVEVIRPNINLFLFDEPSESLDVENKIVMADLFQRMNRMLPSIGGTMLIVSRDQQLIDSCESVININQQEEEQ